MFTSQKVITVIQLLQADTEMVFLSLYNFYIHKDDILKL